ncbi:class I SAM-dependent methyltransferase [Nocardia paucivorans]|uniref:class I SAM-dependent methyltransferase n=1 Tax=Nocardia paucivorans TaxID=114259 RepID=UPI001FE1854E|nr:methyltransferase domain-containing protein [Nocardia paucivorans]
MSVTRSTHPPMFVDHSDTGLVLAGIRRYNLFTTVFFLGRHRRLIDELVRTSGARPGDDAVDIGCGPGKLVRALGARVGPRGSAVGIDPSAEAVAYNSRRDHRPNHRYVRSSAQELPFPDNSFDVVTCTFVMHHIPESRREAALAEMWRVLRPGGRLLLADTHPTRWMRVLFARGGSRHGDATDHFDALDIRRYAQDLRMLGFTEPEYTRIRHMTGTLTATKPSQE